MACVTLPFVLATSPYYFMNKSAKLFCIVGLLDLVTAAKAQIINTVSAWDGVTAAAPFGEPSIATIGQVFTVDPNFTHLDGFALTIANTSSAPVNFSVFLSAWDSIGFHTVGSPLFSSGLVSLPSAATSFVPLLLPTSLSLEGNAQYVAFLTESPFFDGAPDSAKLGFVGSDVYADGGTVFIDNGNDVSLLSTASWSATSSDLAFFATFSTEVAPVPEPSSYGLVGAGLGLALAGFRHYHLKRRRA